MFYGQDRNQIRRFFFDVWQKRREGAPLEPMEKMIARVIEQHPEYHKLLEDPQAIDRDWLPEMGESNPFLHMGMHIAIQEQLTTNRPGGIVEAYQTLLSRVGDAHEVEHRIMECLGETLWQAQRAGTEPDDAYYLDCLKRA